MDQLRNLYRRTAFARYFEALEPIDRATFWVTVVLGFAFALAMQAITAHG